DVGPDVRSRTRRPAPPAQRGTPRRPPRAAPDPRPWSPTWPSWRAWAERARSPPPGPAARRRAPARPRYPRRRLRGRGGSGRSQHPAVRSVPRSPRAGPPGGPAASGPLPPVLRPRWCLRRRGWAGVGHADALEAVGQVFALASGLVQCLQPQSRALFTGDVDVVAVLVGDQVRAVQPADGLDQRSHGVVLLLRVGVSSGVVGEVCVWRDGDGDTSAQGRIMATAATVTYRLSAAHRAHSRVLPAFPRIGTATS